MLLTHTQQGMNRGIKENKFSEDAKALVGRPL